MCNCVCGGGGGGKRPAKVFKTAARPLLMSAVSSLPELQVRRPSGGSEGGERNAVVAADGVCGVGWGGVGWGGVGWGGVGWGGVGWGGVGGVSAQAAACL
jgi:hypothetical protein